MNPTQQGALNKFKRQKLTQEELDLFQRYAWNGFYRGLGAGTVIGGGLLYFCYKRRVSLFMTTIVTGGALLAGIYGGFMTMLPSFTEELMKLPNSPIAKEAREGYYQDPTAEPHPISYTTPYDYTTLPENQYIAEQQQQQKQKQDGNEE